jgi:hypothetical protein
VTVPLIIGSLAITLWDTAESAEAVRVQPGTVRKWASRGHLAPAGLDERGRPLYRAIDVIHAEHKTRAHARRSPYPVQAGKPPALGHIKIDLNSTLWTATQAAQAAIVKPSTIRTWVQRGHLQACSVDLHNKPLYRATDVINAEKATRSRARRRPPTMPTY